MAKNLGVALGVANRCLKSCISKGLVKAKQIPANRYLYYLTPNGAREKSQLLQKKLKYELNFYKRISSICLKTFELCKEKNCNEVILFGSSDLAEMFVLWAQHYQIHIVGIFDPNNNEESFLGVPVINDIKRAPKDKLIILTELDSFSLMLKEARQLNGNDNIIYPEEMLTD